MCFISCDSGFLVRADTVRVTLEYTGVGKSCLSQTTYQKTQMLGTQVKELPQSPIRFTESRCCPVDLNLGTKTENIGEIIHKSLLFEEGDLFWTKRKHWLVFFLSCLPWLIIVISPAREKEMISPKEIDGSPRKSFCEFIGDRNNYHLHCLHQVTGKSK